MRLLSIVMMTLMFFSANGLPTESSPHAAESVDKLIVQKRVGSDNLYKAHQEINNPEEVTRVLILLNEGEWSKVKFERQTPPAYKLYFQPTGGNEAKAMIYEIWFTNGYAEIYISDLHSYKKLNLKDSAVLKKTIL